MSRVKHRITDVIFKEGAQPVILLDDGSELEVNDSVSAKTSARHPTLVTLTTFCVEPSPPTPAEPAQKVRLT